MTARPCAGQLLIRKIQLNNCEAESYTDLKRSLIASHRAQALGQLAHCPIYHFLDSASRNKK
jgi:hypothetical protein